MDTEAVCVPLISSTGHGHASLNRIHYQNGKFALANLLAAALVKNPNILSARFLMRYLMFTKDRLIVPLMTGAANMSISIDRLATVPVTLPSLAKQERIVKLLDEVDDLRELRTRADRNTATFLPAVFHEMFGDPVANSRHYHTALLGEIASVERGRFSPRPRNDPSYFGGEYPFIQTGDISESGGFLTEWKQTLNERGRGVSKEFSAGTIVIAIVGATIGQTAILGRSVYATDSVIGIQVKPECASTEYIVAVLQHWRPVFIAQTPETARANLNAAILKAVEIPLPPFSLQQAFAQRVTKIRDLKVSQAFSLQRIDALFHSLLHLAFTGEL